MSFDWLVRWLLIAVLSIVDAGWMVARGFGVEVVPILHRLEFAAIVIVFCLVFGYLASRRSPDSRLRFVAAATIDIFLTLVQIALFLPAAAAISYLAATIDRPLIDAMLLRADELLGFDWASFAAWVESHSAVTTVFTWTYFSVFWQAGLIIFLKSTQDPGDTNGDLIWAMLISAVACSLISGFLPALGRDGLAGHAPIAALLDVRSGAWHIMDFDKVQGIVTFPSFHAALGIILPYAVRQVRWAFWLLVPLNFVMILSTPTVGGHYLIDTIAGCAVAVLTIWSTGAIRGGLRRLADRRDLRSAGGTA